MLRCAQSQTQNVQRMNSSQERSPQATGLPTALIVQKIMAATGSREKGSPSFLRCVPYVWNAPQEVQFPTTLFSNLFRVLLLTPVALMLFLTCNSSYYNAELKQAQTYHLEGDHEQAKHILDELIKANTDATEAFLLRGKINENNSEFSKAIADYSSVIKQDPRIAKAWSLRGSSYYQMGAFQNAIRDFSTAIELEPDNADLYLYLGNSYGELDMFGDAIRNFNLAREISYGDYYSNLNKAYNDLNAENYSSSLGRASSAIE